MEHTATPWYVESSQDRQDGDSFAAVTEDGHTIVDTFNSGVALIREETDADENGTHVNRWDDQGKADIEFIVRAVNAFDSMRSALLLILDNADYQNGACRLNEMVGAVLPVEMLIKARAAVKLANEEG